jgi:hypothetical protein
MADALSPESADASTGCAACLATIPAMSAAAPATNPRRFIVVTARCSAIAAPPSFVCIDLDAL